jgi:hypothetical protein
MRLTARARRAPIAGLATLLVALCGGGQAAAATSVTSEAGVWFSPGQPAGNALRLIVRVTDDAAAAPGTTERLTVYLPPEVTLQSESFPRCSLGTIEQSGVEACPDGSQLGSGTIEGLLGPASVLELDAFVVNGSTPGALIFVTAVKGSGLRPPPFEAQLAPSDDAAFGSMLVVPIPLVLQQPVPGIYFALTKLDVLLHGTAAAPYVAIADCPLGALGFKSVLDFNQSAPGAPAGPLSTTAAGTCVAAPPPAVTPMPRHAAAASPAPPAPPAPVAAQPERAVADFGLRLQRRRGQVRRLRLTGVSPDALVSVRCLRRCGRRGGELAGAWNGATVRLQRRLRPRSRFEVRVSEEALVTRFARYRVDRRVRSASRTKAGCLDAGGAERACPAT